jgi:hypothetical protein
MCFSSSVIIMLLQIYQLVKLLVFTHVCWAAISSAQPENTERISWYCLPENIELFADLACTLTGQSYLVESAVSISSPNQVPYHSDISPWTHTPLCTDILPTLNNPLCVYINTNYAYGRGISILTTPDMASSFTTLPLSLAEGPNTPLHTSNIHITRKTASKGRMALATKPLHAGEPVAAQAPIFLQHAGIQHLSWQEREELLRAAFSQLPLSTQRLLGKLTSAPAKPELFLSGVVSNHAGFPIAKQGIEYHALFPEMAFFNHACAPKSVRVFFFHLPNPLYYPRLKKISSFSF